MEEPPDGLAVVETAGAGKCLISTKKIKKGEHIFRLTGTLLHRKKVRSFVYPLQIDENMFLDSTNEFENYINHSCSPNCYIDFSHFDFVALRTIRPGEAVTFNYCTSEYDLEEQRCVFQCHCGSLRCLREVRGFRALAWRKKLSLKKYLSPFLLRKLVAEEEKRMVQEAVPVQSPFVPAHAQH